MTKEELNQFIDAFQRRAAHLARLSETGTPKTKRAAVDVLGNALLALLNDELGMRASPEWQRHPTPRAGAFLRHDQEAVAHLSRGLQAWAILAKAQLEVKARTHEAGHKPKRKVAERKAQVLARHEELVAANPTATEATIRAMLKRKFPKIPARTLREYLSGH
jgi:hypothetical protein